MPFLRRLDAERAHRLAIAALRAGLAGSPRIPREPRLVLSTLGLTFANPIGLAAGFDKDAEALGALARLGFGSIEAGTVTPCAQFGNPRPRLFRLAQDRAIINRMGFNSRGLDAFLGGLRTAPRSAPIGVNIGPNRGSAAPQSEFAAMAAAVAGRADWLTLNVSSPNTPGLRAWQVPDRLAAILAAIRNRVPSLPPMLVKLSPDLAEADLPEIVECCAEGGAAGLIVANSTLARPAGLRSGAAGEAGGLSGRPLMARSTELLARTAQLARGRLVLVGCGGVSTGADVVAKLQAGANLVQLYTAFALEGPALLPRLFRELVAELDRHGFANIQAAIGAST